MDERQEYSIIDQINNDKSLAFLKEFREGWINGIQERIDIYDRQGIFLQKRPNGTFSGSSPIHGEGEWRSQETITLNQVHSFLVECNTLKAKNGETLARSTLQDVRIIETEDGMISSKSPIITFHRTEDSSPFRTNVHRGISLGLYEQDFVRGNYHRNAFDHLVVLGSADPESSVSPFALRIDVEDKKTKGSVVDKTGNHFGIKRDVYAPTAFEDIGIYAVGSANEHKILVGIDQIGKPGYYVSVQFPLKLPTNVFDDFIKYQMIQNISFLWNEIGASLHFTHLGITVGSKK